MTETPIPFQWIPIIKLVATKHRVETANIFSRRQDFRYVWARYEIFYRLKAERKIRVAWIAQRFGMDPATIRYGIAQFCTKSDLPFPWGMRASGGRIKLTKRSAAKGIPYARKAAGAA